MCLSLECMLILASQAVVGEQGLCFCFIREHILSQLRIQKNYSPVDFLMCVPLRGKFMSKINLNLSVKLYVLLLHQQKRSPKKLEIFFLQIIYLY